MIGIIPTLNKIKDSRKRSELCLIFIEELGGYKTHLENIGMAGGQDRVFIELQKVKKIIQNINRMVMDKH